MLFRRLYNDKTLKAMAKDCLKELDFADRDKDLIFEDMEVMTDFELHRFSMGYKVSFDVVELHSLYTELHFSLSL